MISDINNNLLSNEGFTEIENVGQGGYGTVYKCKNKRNKLVAVKIIDVKDVQDINKGFEEAFHLNRLNHSNIVKVYKAFLLNGNKLAIEMEYLNFGNLLNLIKNKIYLPEKLIYKILQQAGSALQYLEEHEVVHRDLNLKNIVVKHLDLQKEEIEIVLIDFGLIKNINSTKSTSLIGTEGYLSLELLQSINNNHIPYSFKSDIFALGVVLYRLMSYDLITDIGRSFYSFNEQTIKDLITNNIKNNKNVKYSDKLINLILKMLEKDTIERFNAEQILNEILNNEKNLIVNRNLQNINEKDKFKNNNETKLIKIDETYNEEQILNYVKTNNNNLIVVNENLQNKIANNEKNLNKSLQNLKEDKFKIKNETKLIGFSNQFEFVEKIDSFKIYFKETKKGSFLNYLFGSGVIEQQVEKTETFNCPHDILIDNDLIYIVDLNNSRIVIFNLENNQFIKQFNLNFEPSCIKLDKTNDTLLIGDFYYNVIYRFNKNFELLQQYGNNNGKKSFLTSISGIEVDESNGNIFICNFNNEKVQILTKDFKLIKEFTNNLKGPYNILLNNEKNELIISNGDYYDHCIKIFTKDGQFIKSIGTKGNKESEFNYPRGFIYDIVNNQYIICDSKNNRIQIFNENFEFIKSFGKEGNGQNEFNYPRNLIINYKTGQLFIVDQNNHCIKIYK